MEKHWGHTVKFADTRLNGQCSVGRECNLDHVSG
jgi:hypothetical protein